MADNYPYPKIAWQVATSGNRTVLQSSQIYDKEIEKLLTNWLIKELTIDPNVADNMKYSARSLSSRRLPGEEGKRIEIRNVPPDLLAEITGIQVSDYSNLWAMHMAYHRP